MKDERKRIGLTQTELAERCGLTKRSQVNIEKDEHVPGGTYLAAASEMGIDVLYVLTGQRQGMSTEEVQLVSAYRLAPPEVRLAVAAALGATAKAAGRAKLVMHQSDIGQVLSGCEVSQPNLTTINVGGRRKKNRT
ncbi:helix-turn-helix domain-containing protein [Xanthomonas translucens]|uniref:helix-turn-helix domain-containing protein n=1 Tax=Xanthomonas campestris pv. translucens TaxID=343 RepID=UPI001F417BC4|nr:helix-turn-helix transcriptional regulator [Xanthomonas translucens]